MTSAIAAPSSILLVNPSSRLALRQPPVPVSIQRSFTDENPHRHGSAFRSLPRRIARIHASAGASSNTISNSYDKPMASRWISLSILRRPHRSRLETPFKNRLPHLTGKHLDSRAAYPRAFFTRAYHGVCEAHTLHLHRRMILFSLEIVHSFLSFDTCTSNFSMKKETTND